MGCSAGTGEGSSDGGGGTVGLGDGGGAEGVSDMTEGGGLLSATSASVPEAPYTTRKRVTAISTAATANIAIIGFLFLIYVPVFSLFQSES